MHSVVRVMFAVALLLGYGATKIMADEHPQGGSEHPTKGKSEAKPGEAGSGSEHPTKGTEHPKGKKKDKKKGDKKDEKKNEPTSWNKDAVEKDLRAYIDTESNRNEGKFAVKDDEANKTRELSLDKIHTDKIVQLDDGTSFVCADFKDASGEKVDLDFFLKPDASGGVQKVDRIQVHKVNGKPRYTYVKRDGKWVQERSS